MNRAAFRAGPGLALMVLGTVVLAGCGGARTHGVQGKVVVEGGDVAKLAQSTIEAQLESDPAVRASGEIQPDGSFELTTLKDGQVLDGAVEGTYTARIILADHQPEGSDEDDDEAPAPRRKKKGPKLPVSQKYLDFKTSGWSFKVPTDGSVTLTASAGKK
jgi:hypothetical protein